jgi:hypothetical protein
MDSSVQLINRHVFASLPGGPTLVDTGSPRSYAEGRTLLWRGCAHAVEDGRAQGLNFTQLSREIGFPFAALLGMDRLAETSWLLVNSGCVSTRRCLPAGPPCPTNPSGVYRS